MRFNLIEMEKSIELSKYVPKLLTGVFNDMTMLAIKDNEIPV